MLGGRLRFEIIRGCASFLGVLGKVGWVAWVGVERGFVHIDGACCSSLGFCSRCVRARVCAFAFACRVQIQEGSIYCLSLF